MTRYIHSFRKYMSCFGIRRYWNAEAGSVSVEKVIILPVIVWALTASFTFTDAFRQQTSLQKSVYTIADLVSRASGTDLTPGYLEGIHGFMQRMNDAGQEVQMRMTLIGWDDDEQEYRVVWSYANEGGSLTALDNGILNTVYHTQIPSIATGETLLLTEGSVWYEPVFRVGLQSQFFSEIALTRPRFAPGIPFLDPDAPPPPSAWCEYVVDSCGM